MEYNFKGIGSRISKERKAAGFKSQQAFIDYLQQNYGYSIGRNTLSAIENGNTGHYDCELLYILCDIFNCEMGYLLCEYECKTGRNTDIVKVTGLSEKAVIKLQDISANNRRSAHSDILSAIIENNNLEYLLALLGYSISAKAAPNIYTEQLPQHRFYKDCKGNLIDSWDYTKCPTVSVDIDGQEMEVLKEGLTDSVLNTHIMQELPHIADIYMQSHNITPAQREQEYRQYMRPVQQRLFNDEISEQEYKDIEKAWLQDK